MIRRRIRDMLRRHRSLSLVRQIKALYRGSWEHNPLGARQTTGIPMRYGTGIDWDEFHTPTEYHGIPD